MTQDTTPEGVAALISELRDRPRFVAEGPRYLMQLNERAADALSRLTAGAGEAKPHDWFERLGMTCCRSCGVVRNDTSDARPCAGPISVAPRAFPAPQAPAVTDALAKVREAVVLAIAFLGRDQGSDRLDRTINQLIPQLAEADKIALAALHPAKPLTDPRFPVREGETAETTGYYAHRNLIAHVISWAGWRDAGNNALPARWGIEEADWDWREYLHDADDYLAAKAEVAALSSSTPEAE